MSVADTQERPVDPALARRWRDAEAAFFGGTITEPEMYDASIRLVRGLADSLRDAISEAALEDAYETRGGAWFEARMAVMNLPHADWLDLDTARDAAFNLRLGELRGEILTRATAARLAAARQAGEAWLVAADGEVGIAGQRTYRRVEIHTRSGVALFGYSARDWQRGETFWLEVVPVDPDSGARVRGAPSLQEPRAYSDRPALTRAFGRARRQYGQGA